MPKIKNLVCLSLSVVMALSLLVGCGSKETPKQEVKKDETKTTSAPEKQVKLTWVNWGSMEEATKPAFTAMVKDFEQKNPNIKIDSVGYAYNSMSDTLLMLSAAGTAPDIAQSAAVWVAPLNATGTLAPMDTVLDKTIIADFYPGTLKGTTINSKLMSVPWNIGAVLLYYNKVLAQKAGITSVPKTWSEMMDQAQKISKLGKDEKGNKIYGVSVSSKKLAGAGYFFLPNIWQNGGDFTDEKGKVVLDSPGTIAAYKEVKQMMESEVAPAGLEIKETRNLFAQGQVGFHFDIVAAHGIFQAGSPKGKEFAKDYGVMRIPGVKGPEGISFSSDHQFVVFKDSKNIKDSAKFIDYMTGPSGMKVYMDNGVLVLPARKATEGLDKYKTADENLKPFLDALPTIRSLPVQDSQFLKACELVAEAIQRVGLNKEDPAKVVPELDKQIKTLYKQ